MKKFMKLAFVAAFAAIAGYNIHENQKVVTMSDLMLANVEALARYEQPDTSECVFDHNTTCVALHPTNPNLDKYVPYSRWP